MLAQDLNTRGLQGWIQDNVVPLVLLGIAIILLWIGGRGDNAGVARRSVGSHRRSDRAGHRGLRQRPPDRRVPRPPDHGLTAVLVRTDDEVYRIDSVWLGPPRATFPWRARYVSYGLGLVVMILVMFVQRRVGIGLDFFSVAWALVLTVVRHPAAGEADRLRAPARAGPRAVPARGPRSAGPHRRRRRSGAVSGARAGSAPRPPKRRAGAPRGGRPEGTGPCRGVRRGGTKGRVPAEIPAATPPGGRPRSPAGGAAATWRARRTCPSTPRTSRCARSTGT